MSDPNDTPAGVTGPGAGDRVRELREHLEQARAALDALDRLLPAGSGGIDDSANATDSACGEPGT